MEALQWNMRQLNFVHFALRAATLITLKVFEYEVSICKDTVLIVAII